MSSNQCKYCLHILSTPSKLERHQKTAKFCIKIQQEQGHVVDVKMYSCDYCKYGDM